LDKWEKGRGFWAKSPSSSSLPHDTERRRQEADRGRGRGADDLVRGDGRELGRNEEEVEGN
jgi:hypothetical protein